MYEKWLVLQGNQAYNVNFGHACNTTTIPMIVPEGNVVVRWSQGIHLYTALLKIWIRFLYGINVYCETDA